MTIRTRLLVFSVLAVTAWLSLNPVADAAPLNPIPSPQVAGQGEVYADGQVVVENGACQEYVEPAGCFDFLTNNILTRACHSISTDFKRNNCWPRPFVWNDRQAARAPFVVMTNKGWQRENTLGEYHFNRDTGKLNESGRMRAHWIVTQEIPSRHSIFVQRAMQPEMTLARVDSVQQWVARIVPHGEMPPVIETNLPAPGRPAEEADHIWVEYLKSMPPPRLPENTSMDTGYSGQ